MNQNANSAKVIGTWKQGDFKKTSIRNMNDSWTGLLKVPKPSGRGIDVIRIVGAKELFTKRIRETRENLEIKGKVKTQNTISGKVEIFILAEEVNIVKDGKRENIITISGNVCKKPFFRKLKDGTELLDMIIAVDHPYHVKNEVAYLPVVFWNRYARQLKNVEVGEKLNIRSYIAEREYEKDGKKQIAYELSVLGCNEGRAKKRA